MENYGKILIVDDNATNLKVVSESLQSLKDKGATILIAKNGEKALEIANKTIPNIIVLDVNMPEMDGFEVCQLLKENPRTKDIPVIFLTAQTDIESKLKGLRLGGIDYITKPFYKEEVVTRVKSQLEIWNLKRSLKTQNREVQESLGYAKKIQSAILPSKDKMNKILNDFFVYYRPKDIVSGDFYWLEQQRNDIYIAAVDCTGHGVPGAFISFIGYGLLNHILLKIPGASPSVILVELDEMLKHYLNQGHHETETQDGMDIALCRINYEKEEIEFAGAHRTLYHINAGELKKIKGSRAPIGGTQIKKKSFENHLISFKEGDRIYLCSDGYADQFGGERGKKFSPLRFEELLIRLIDVPIVEQEEIFDKTITDWRGAEDIVDDILVLGVQL